MRILLLLLFPLLTLAAPRTPLYYDLDLGISRDISGSDTITGIGLEVSGAVTATTLIVSESISGPFELDRVEGSTPASFTKLRDFITTNASTGVVSGGLMSDNGDGTIKIAAGSGSIRDSSDPFGKMYFTTWPENSSVSLEQDVLAYVYMQYNGPLTDSSIVTSTTELSDVYSNIYLGTAFRNSVKVHTGSALAYNVNDTPVRVIKRLQSLEPFARASGGVTSETGTRNIAITAGVFWEGTNEITTAAFDSSGSDTFIAEYQDGASGYTQVAAQTQIDNLQYDDGSGTLAALSANRYGVHWVYLELDGDVIALYGRGNYTLPQAQDADPPADTPDHYEKHSRLIAKIIIKQADTVFTSVENPFASQFTPSLATDHGTLLGLTDDDHTQYVLADGTRAMTELNVSGAITATTTITASEYISSTLFRGNIEAAYLPGATFTTLGEGFTFVASAGTQNELFVSDASSATIDIAAGIGTIRPVDSDTSTINFFDWSTAVSQAIPLDTTRFVGVEYNAGSPQVIIKTTDTWNLDTEFPIATVVNESNSLYIDNNPWVANDNNTNLIERFDAQGRIVRDERVGGLIISELGTRNISVTAGAMFSRMTEYTIAALDTSASDTFDTYYQDGSGGFTKGTGVTQWQNTQYDDGSGTLANLGNNKYGDNWFFECLDNSLVMVYGVEEYASESAAQAASAPSLLPDRVTYTCILIGRVVFEKDAATADAVQTTFGISFSAANVQNHNNLGNIQGGTTDEYYHLTSAEHASATGDIYLLNNADDSTSGVLTAAGFTTSGIVTATTRTSTGSLCDENGANCVDPANLYDTADDLYVLVAGDTMTGALTVTNSSTIQANDGSGNYANLTYFGTRYNRSISYIDQFAVGGDIWFRTSEVSNNDTTAMVILDNGNVGIGPDSSPDALLDVQGDMIVDSDITAGGLTTSGIVTATTRVSSAKYCDENGANCTDMADGPFLMTDGGNTMDANIVFSSNYAIQSGGANLYFDGTGSTIFIRPGSVGGGTSTDISFGFGTDVIKVASNNWNVDSSGNADFAGNVGVGTASPSTNLHVYQDNSTVSGNGVEIEQDGTGDAATRYLITGARWWSTGVDNSDSDKYKISPNADLASSPAITIETGGNVGIANSSPAAPLHITTSSPTSATMIIEGGAGAAVDGSQMAALQFGSNDGSVNNTNNIGAQILMESGTANGAGQELAFYTFNQGGSPDLAEHMRIDYLGNVGIGTDSPAQKLHVDGTARVTSGDMQVYDTTPRYWLYSEGGVNSWELFANISDSVNSQFQIENNNNVRFVIDANGDVGVGTDTSPDYDLHVNSTTESKVIEIESGGDGNSSAILFTRERSTGTGVSGALIRLLGSTSTNNAYLEFMAESSLGIANTDTRGMMRLYGDSSGGVAFINGDTAAVGKDLRIRSILNDDGDNETEYSRIQTEVLDETDTTEDAEIQFYNMRAGTLVQSMTIDENGNVGIGDADPDAELDVSTGSIYAGELCDENGANCSDLSSGLSSSVWTSSTNFVTVENVDVGINTATPSGLLHINADGSANEFYYSRGGSNVFSINADGFNTNIAATNDFIVDTGTALSALFIEDNTGNVGLGTESPTATLDVSGAVSITGTDADLFVDDDIIVSSSNTDGFADIVTDTTTGFLRVSGGSPGGSANGANFIVTGNDNVSAGAAGRLLLAAGNTFTDTTDGSISMRVGGSGTDAILTYAGNFGIGVDDPAEILEINGNFLLTASASVTRTIQAETPLTSQDGTNLLIAAGDGYDDAGGGDDNAGGHLILRSGDSTCDGSLCGEAGSHLYIQSGDGEGLANGGNIIMQPGSGVLGGHVRIGDYLQSGTGDFDLTIGDSSTSLSGHEGSVTGGIHIVAGTSPNLTIEGTTKAELSLYDNGEGEFITMRSEGGYWSMNTVFPSGTDKTSDIMTIDLATGYVGYGDSTPGANLSVSGNFAIAPTTPVVLTSDNTAIGGSGVSYFRFSSNNATPANRTFTLAQCNADGQILRLHITANAAQLIDDAANSDAGNVRLAGNWEPTTEGTLTLLCDGTDWVETSRTAL